ncbi:MAG: nitrous oxide-stimulated promoter family protein [Dehalococcoidia bacterium]|nr:nitrous oxide-stimulated promoter family protein [Dehalococcoidia bacterium]
MAGIFERLNDKKRKDIRVLSEFIAVYCREQHKAEDSKVFSINDDKLKSVLGNKEIVLCGDCSKLLHHGIAKLLLCPYDPKPACRKCETHCYAPDYRERIREVMRFSGPYLIKRGRLDLLAHYLS